MSQFKLICDNEDSHRYTQVVFKTEDLDEVLVNMEEFLRGCGYYFNGSLQLVDDEPVTGWHKEWVPNTENPWYGEQPPDFAPVVDSEGGVE